MAQIDINTAKENDLTRIVFSGPVYGSSILEALHRFYALEITARVLWDFSDGDVSQVKTEELFAIIDATNSYAQKRSDCKTALLVNSTLAFGIARMFQALFDLERYPIQMEVFKSEDEALAWLMKEVNIG